MNDNNTAFADWVFASGNIDALVRQLSSIFYGENFKQAAAQLNRSVRAYAANIRRFMTPAYQRSKSENNEEYDYFWEKFFQYFRERSFGPSLQNLNKIESPPSEPQQGECVSSQFGNIAPFCYGRAREWDRRLREDMNDNELVPVWAHADNDDFKRHHDEDVA